MYVSTYAVTLRLCWYDTVLRDTALDWWSGWQSWCHQCCVTVNFEARIECQNIIPYINHIYIYKYIYIYIYTYFRVGITRSKVLGGFGCFCYFCFHGKLLQVNPVNKSQVKIWPKACCHYWRGAFGRFGEAPGNKVRSLWFSQFFVKPRYGVI